MSYIRAGRSGQYVNIPGGSNYYLYGDGETIGGWSYGEFAAYIAATIEEAGWTPTNDEDPSIAAIQSGFENYFDGFDTDTDMSIMPPERAEIFCQCVDFRIDELALTDSLHESMKEYADSFDAARECAYCGEEFYPSFYNDSTEYCCRDDECNLEQKADRYDTTPRVIKNGEMLYWMLVREYGWENNEALDAETEYILENGGSQSH